MRDHTIAAIIHKELQMNQSGNRYMIQFHSSKQFSAVYRLVQDQLQEFPNFTLLRPLPIISGFSCTLSNPDRLLSLSPWLSIYPDTKIMASEQCLSASPPIREVRQLAFIQPTEGMPHPMPVTYDKKALIPWGVREIKAPSAWPRSSGAKIKVAVIDTGIDFTHPDLRQTAMGGINLIEPMRPPFDDNGHGTHISGTIAAASTRSGVMGVAPEAHIYAVKAFDRQGTAYVSDIVSGIHWCILNQMDIINMSFGMKTSHKALETAVRTAYRAGKVIVASSGNEGNEDEIDYPARYRNVIAVGATTKQGKIAPFSNRGSQIDIYAPGHKVLSTWLNGYYHELSGTSMATSHVSGVIALLLAARPNLLPKEIKRLLTHSTTSITLNRVRMKQGQVNALQCLRVAGKKKP